jgi:hypothetical protein
MRVVCGVRRVSSTSFGKLLLSCGETVSHELRASEDYMARNYSTDPEICHQHALSCDYLASDDGVYVSFDLDTASSSAHMHTYVVTHGSSKTEPHG